MSAQLAIDRSVRGLGYELVDVERAAGGVLRVTIDHPAQPAGEAERFITVDDCERVTRQLQHVLEVEGLAYERLEVSSPGLDRPLKSAADFARFAGEQVEVTLKVPFKGRKRFRGELLANGEGWRLLLAPTAPAAAAKRHAASRSGRKAAAGTGGADGVAPAVGEAEAATKAFDFSLDEVREAHLVPIIDFKGRSTAPHSAPAQRMRAHEEGNGGLRQ